jgi:P pilus assembly chaperone PapD
MKKITFLTWCFLWAFIGTANAQFFIEEGKVVVPISPGERVSKTLLVHNTSNESLTLRAYWEDFQYQAPFDGAKLFLAAGTAPGSASQWITYSPQQFTIPPSGQQKVEYMVTAPATLKGGHYGVLFFEKAGEPIKDATGVKLVSRVGCLFFIEAKDKKKVAALQNIKISSGTVSGDFVNKGDVVLIPQTTYYIMDDQGVVADRGEIKKLYVPPAATASWEIPLIPGLAAGHFTMVINADMEDGDVVVKEVDFVKDAKGKLTIGNMRD